MIFICYYVVMTETVSDTNLFACKECGLHYSDEVTAQECATWCKQHKSCNMDITALSVERNPTTP